MMCRRWMRAEGDTPARLPSPLPLPSEARPGPPAAGRAGGRLRAWLHSAAPSQRAGGRAAALAGRRSPREAEGAGRGRGGGGARRRRDRGELAAARARRKVGAG